MPFGTGMVLTSGTPSRRLDATGTASRLLATVDNVGSRPVPWRTRCLLYVPVGDYLISAIYEQPWYRLGHRRDTGKDPRRIAVIDWLRSPADRWWQRAAALLSESGSLSNSGWREPSHWVTIESGCEILSIDMERMFT